MKNAPHYSNLTFAALLVSTFLWGLVHKDAAIIGFIIISICWTVTRIIKEAIISMLVLTSQDDENKKDQ